MQTLPSYITTGESGFETDDLFVYVRKKKRKERFMEATEDVHDIQELPHGVFFLKIGCCVYACICVLKFSSILVNGGRHFTWQRSYITAYSDLSCCESPSDGDTLHDSVRKTAAYSNHSRCPSKSPSDSVEETAAYSNYSCCPSKSPSDRDDLRDSVKETGA